MRYTPITFISRTEPASESDHLDEAPPGERGSSWRRKLALAGVALVAIRLLRSLGSGRSDDRTDASDDSTGSGGTGSSLARKAGGLVVAVAMAAAMRKLRRRLMGG